MIKTASCQQKELQEGQRKKCNPYIKNKTVNRNCLWGDPNVRRQSPQRSYYKHTQRTKRSRLNKGKYADKDLSSRK